MHFWRAHPPLWAQPWQKDWLLSVYGCVPESLGPEPFWGLLSGHSGSILPSLLGPEWAMVRPMRVQVPQACVSTDLTPGCMFPHPHPHPVKIEAPSIPRSHFPLKHRTVISLNTIWRLLASAPHFSQTLINVTGVYSFFLLFHFLQNVSALWPAEFILSSGSSALLAWL